MAMSVGDAVKLLKIQLKVQNFFSEDIQWDRLEALAGLMFDTVP